MILFPKWLKRRQTSEEKDLLKDMCHNKKSESENFRNLVKGLKSLESCEDP